MCFLYLCRIQSVCFVFEGVTISAYNPGFTTDCKDCVAAYATDLEGCEDDESFIDAYDYACFGWRGFDCLDWYLLKQF